jgi:glycosyltransferase involved in cell wall biosynthesis
MTKKIELCLLVWNELEGCQKDIPLIPDIFDRIYALDGGSNDGTIEFLRSRSIEVIGQTRHSYNGAYLDALDHFKGDALVFFHPKGTINVESLHEMRLLMHEGYDFVLASRLSKESQNEEDKRILRFRKWFVRAIAIVAKIRWGLTKNSYINDPLHGYRGVSRKFVDSLVLLDHGVTADLEMTRHAYSKQLTSVSFPVIEVERASGDTHFPAFKTGKKLLSYILRFS